MIAGWIKWQHQGSKRSWTVRLDLKQPISGVLSLTGALLLLYVFFFFLSIKPLWMDSLFVVLNFWFWTTNRVWWICKSPLRWSLETWPQVRNIIIMKKGLLAKLSLSLITFVLLQPCAFTLHCSWDLHGWCSHATIYYLPAMLPMRLFSSISSRVGLDPKGKFYNISHRTIYDIYIQLINKQVLLLETKPVWCNMLVQFLALALCF